MYLSSSPGPQAEGFLDIWSRWDADHFEVVARHGWVGPLAEPARPAAFFPLYPLAMRPLMWAGLPPIAAGMLISYLASIVACTFLIKLGDEEIEPGAGRRAAFYLLLFPTAVFLAAPYSEALFLAGTIPAFYLARRQRWLMASLPAAVAVATRAAGMFLLLGLAFEYVRQALRDKRWTGQRLRDAAICLAVGAVPLVLYGLYLWRVRGTPWQFLIDQEQGWGRDFPTAPWRAFMATWDTRSGLTYPANWIFAWRIEIVAALAGVMLTLWALIEKEWGYAAYMGSFMAVLLMSTWYFSVPRMLLSLFPAMLFLASGTTRARGRHELALVALAPVAAMGVIVYTRGAWFY
ncbi:MAG TPA: mannosyltransferase family protein [Actinomycetota bacterium]|nr:mannosyltransferase family protein [Actinomycetota bacterium]